MNLARLSGIGQPFIEEFDDTFGENSLFFQEVIAVLKGGDAAASLDEQGNWLKANPDSADLHHYKQKCLTFAPDERARLYTEVKRVVFLALGLFKAREGSQEQAKAWLTAYADTGIGIDPASIATGYQQWTSNWLDWMLFLTEALRGEQRSLMAYFLFEMVGGLTDEAAQDYRARIRSLAAPQHTVEMIALGWNGQTQHGERCQLALEQIPGETGFYRHPRCLLLPCDSVFLKSIADAWAMITAPVGFQWNQGPPAISRWEESGGAIRWRLSIPGEGRLEAASSGSIGGAFGAGSILLCMGESNDNYGITACADAQGNFSAVDSQSVEPKAQGAINGGVKDLIVCQAQYESWSPLFSNAAISLHEASNSLEAAKLIAAASKPRQAVIKKVCQDNSNLDILMKNLENRAAIPIQQYYIESPLLKEVKRERLPQGDGKDEQDTFFRSHLPKWLGRYEEAGSREEYDHDPVSLQDALQDNDRKRLLIIGPPGSGKTALTRYIAMRVLDKENPLLESSRIIPIRIRLREWEEKSEMSLLKYIHSTFEDISSSPNMELWKLWIERGEVLLILDGLDETSAGFANTVADLLNANYANNCRIVITCRSLSRKRLESIAAGACPIFTPNPFYEEQQRKFIEKYAQITGKALRADDLLAELEANNLTEMGANPLLLSLICYVVADQKSMPLPQKSMTLPTTRTELYDKAIAEILNDSLDPCNAEDKPKSPIEAPYVLQALEEIAFRMMLQETNRNVCSRVTALDYLAQIINEGMFNGRTGITSSDLLPYLLRSSRLFSGEKICDFFHTTVQEYLAARAIKRRAKACGFDGESVEMPGEVGEWNESQWQKAFRRIDAAFAEYFPPEAMESIEKRLNSENSEEREEAERALKSRRQQAEKGLAESEKLIALLDHKAWLEEWQEVFLFLAGTLEDPVPLLDILSDGNNIRRDDWARHRLALAALCIAEIAPEKRNITVAGGFAFVDRQER